MIGLPTRRLLRLATMAAASPFAAFFSRAADREDRFVHRIFIIGGTDGLDRSAGLIARLAERTGVELS